MGVQLGTPPLREALFEIRWDLEQHNSEPPQDPAYPLIVGLLYERVKALYPEIQDLPQARLPFEMLQHQVTHRFRAGKDEWPVVQIGPGIAAVNFTRPYSWQSFREAIEGFLRSLRETFQGSKLELPRFNQILLRYINEVELPQDHSLATFLEDKMHIALQAPCPNASSPIGTKLECVYRLEQPKGQGILNLAAQPANRRVVFNLIVVSAQNDVPSFEGLPLWLADAHDVIEDWFFELIAGDLFQDFQKEHLNG